MNSDPCGSLKIWYSRANYTTPVSASLGGYFASSNVNGVQRHSTFYSGTVLQFIANWCYIELAMDPFGDTQTMPSPTVALINLGLSPKSLMAVINRMDWTKPDFIPPLHLPAQKFPQKYSPPTEFTKFGELPMELRLKICKSWGERGSWILNCVAFLRRYFFPETNFWTITNMLFTKGIMLAPFKGTSTFG